jgi:hypothetical protein
MPGVAAQMARGYRYWLHSLMLGEAVGAIKQPKACQPLHLVPNHHGVTDWTAPAAPRPLRLRLAGQYQALCPVLESRGRRGKTISK